MQTLRVQPGAAGGGKADWRRALWLAAVVVAVAWHSPASAEWSATLPLLKACVPSTPPDLPARWHATGLLMPFEQGQLDIGDFDYDGNLPALRATIYGLQSGAVDLLITADDTYVLLGPHRSPTQCLSIGPKLRPPSPQWLKSDSVCVGEAPIGNQELQWWQKPGFDVARYWFTKDSRLPWRSMFLKRSLDPAVIGDYAMTYFPTFTPAPQSDLSELQKFCKANAKPAPADYGETPTARALMAIPNKDAQAEREQRVATLMPGLSDKQCPAMTPARWPDRFVMTAIVTPMRIEDTPYPTVIYYDWTGAQAMLVLPFHSFPPLLQGVLSLQKGTGYALHFSDPVKRTGLCRAALPGAVKPDWMAQASCRCQGVIAGNTALSPSGETQILSCPIKDQAPRIMWSWYTTQSKPVMFVEAAPESGGVVLADYYDWVPGQTGQPSDFGIPNACLPLSKPDGTPANATPVRANASCSDCHTVH